MAHGRYPRQSPLPPPPTSTWEGGGGAGGGARPAYSLRPPGLCSYHRPHYRRHMLRCPRLVPQAHGAPSSKKKKTSGGGRRRKGNRRQLKGKRRRWDAVEVIACHRLLSILPTRGTSVECPANWCSSLDPTSAGHISCPGSTGLGTCRSGVTPSPCCYSSWPHPATLGRALRGSWVENPSGYRSG